MKISMQITVVAACLLSVPVVSGAELKVKNLSPAADSATTAVLIGRAIADNMIVTLEFEAPESMWMQAGNPPKWTEHRPSKGEHFHVEVKPVDPGSKTRIPYAEVKFNAVNHDNNKTVSGSLHPSWGSSGLHYGYNSPLAGDGSYEATVTVGVPTFGRTDESKDLWKKPVVAKFHFKLANGKLTEVTEPAPEPK